MNSSAVVERRSCRTLSSQWAESSSCVLLLPFGVVKHGFKMFRVYWFVLVVKLSKCNQSVECFLHGQAKALM